MQLPANTLTYYDLVQRLIDRRNLEGTGRQLSQARTAVMTGYADFFRQYDWKYCQRRVVIQATAPESFTASYDHTGGAYERLVTISSGTVPTWVEVGQMLVGEQFYFVERRIDGTRFTLRADSNPGSDFTSTSITIYRDSYQLPRNIKRIDQVWCTTRFAKMSYMHDTHHTQFSRSFLTGTPTHYGLRASNYVHGSMDFVLLPAPSEAETYEISGVFLPRALSIYEHNASDGACVGGNVFTSDQAEFTQAMVGSVLRISPDESLPMGNGVYNEEEGRSVYQYQVLITKVNSATSVEVDGTLPVFTGRGWSVSDIVDIDQQVGLKFLEWLIIEALLMNTIASYEEVGHVRSHRAEAGHIALAANKSINWSQQQNSVPLWMYDFTASTHIPPEMG